MILLFSSNVDGGILQFEVQLLAEMHKFGIASCCFIPEGGKVTIPPNIAGKVLFYKKFKTLNASSKRIRHLANRILSVEPDIVWYVDSAILSTQLCCYLKGKVVQYLTIHDPAGIHPTNHISAKDRVKRFFEYSMEQRGMREASKIFLLSPESYKMYIKKKPCYRNKTDVFILGAHVPCEVGRMPKECKAIRKPYFLFFGRIDKYKGILTMLRTYQLLDGSRLPLVIAGKGSFTDKEWALLKRTKGIVLLNRYIEDGEMVWLFEHAAATILPYIEASQSGVIPISYKFGVPVITSDVRGLTQFVDEQKSGFVCKKEADYLYAMKQVQNNEVWKMMGEKAKEYYISNMDWHSSLDKLMHKIKAGCI